MGTNIDGVREFDLSDPTSIWLRAGEDAVLMLDFKRDMSAFTFEAMYSEYRWPYTPSSYDIMDSGSLDPSQIDLSEISDGILRVEITSDNISLFQDRRICLKIKVSDGSKSWIASSRTIKIGESD